LIKTKSPYWRYEIERESAIDIVAVVALDPATFSRSTTSLRQPCTIGRLGEATLEHVNVGDQAQFHRLEAGVLVEAPGRSVLRPHATGH
jgi:hypothetical protein